MLPSRQWSSWSGFPAPAYMSNLFYILEVKTTIVPHRSCGQLYSRITELMFVAGKKKNLSLVEEHIKFDQTTGPFVEFLFLFEIVEMERAEAVHLCLQSIHKLQQMFVLFLYREDTVVKIWSGLRTKALG